MNVARRSETQDALRGSHPRFKIAIVTSIHPDFDARLWKYARLVRDLGHETHLVCPWQVEDGTLVEGIHFHTFEPVKERSKRLWNIPQRIMPKLSPLLPGIDLIHFHDPDLLPFMTALRIWKRKRVIYDVHENYPGEMLNREYLPRPVRYGLCVAVYLAQAIGSHILRNVALVSHHQEEGEFRSKWLRKVVMRNFASLELMKSVTDDYASRADAVVFTGSHHINNGSLLLLEIAQRTHQRAPHVRFYAPDRFWVAQFRERFLAERKARGLEDVVIIVPNVKPHLLVKELLNRATIAVSPSLRVPQQIKGAHNKTFEFMAAALPIVSSDLPDEIEQVVGNECGLVAQPEDPETFVQAILTLVNDRALAERMGRNGQRAFKAKYSWEAQGDKLRAFYESIMGASASSRQEQV